MKTISVQQVERIAFDLAKKWMEWDEPIPDFSSRYPGILESCLSNAFQTHQKKDLYPGLFDKAAMIFYQMIKNHPFLNGNKRIAVTTLLVFLWLNDRWLSATNEEMYKLAVWVAESNPQLKGGVLLAIKEFLQKNSMRPMAKRSS
ncbi:MAG: type II toxin-antitoxin system death-on-curing family toxin [Actinomycetota bacterium]